jgi:hypothetical protein
MDMKSLLTMALITIAYTPPGPNPYSTIGAIVLPPGYTRLAAGPGSFAAWLRQLPLKKDRTVFLYDGSPKRNQTAQFAVLDVSVGHQDLQQCADAVMRLRAEYLYAIRAFSNIRFYNDRGDCIAFWQSTGPRPTTRVAFDHYLTKVFEYCGTHSLEKQLQKPKPVTTIEAGDVFIKGGYPGHAMIVVDVAADKQGHRIYMLAQSYMPAQDIHIVVNPADPQNFVGASSLAPSRSFPSPSLGNPWYSADDAKSLIETPEWTFTINQLRGWPSGN